jgi:hypothetical protein
MIAVREATLEDGLFVLANLREQEKRTILKLGIDAEEVLRNALENDYPSFVIDVAGRPAVVCGASSDTMLGEPRLWMLTTPIIENHQITFLRTSRRYVQWMRKTYGPIIGMVDCDFEKSRQWLRWIGFKEIQSGEYIVMRYS